MPASRRKLSVLILSFDGRAHLEGCLPALRAQRDPGCSWEALVLDNGSQDGTASWIREHHAWVRLVESPTNLGFAAGNNLLAQYAEGDALVLLNNDTRPEPDWLAALADADAAAAADVAAIAGRLVDWEGKKLDFGRGIRTFDGHAFQLDFGRRLEVARMPATGEEVAFACGANMLVRKRSFLEAGAFDAGFFAYLEDVDLCWRLWAGGERIEACSAAVVRHRSAGTSARIDRFRRGSLFERNALLTVHKNLDDELWPQLMPAILVTFLARIEALVVAGNPGAEVLREEALTGRRVMSGEPADTGTLGRDWRAKLRLYGPVGFAHRATRRLFARAGRAAGLGAGGFRLDHPHALAHLRAMSQFLATLDESAVGREAARRRRKRSDRELAERFPLHLIPTYPGDEKLFASPGFAGLLPRTPVLARASLAEMMELPSGESD